MKLVPGTLTGRTLLVLLTGLVVSNLVGLLIFAGERDSALSSLTGASVAERIASVVQSMERTPTEARADLLCSRISPGFVVGLAATADVEPGPESWRSRRIRSALGNFLDESLSNRLRIARDAPGSAPATRQTFTGALKLCKGPVSQMMKGMEGMMGMKGMMGMGRMNGPQRRGQAWRRSETLRVSYRLDDGSWLNFRTHAPHFDSIWQSRFLLAFVFMAVVVSALSVWAVRRSTAPLALFAWAAERLGRDVNAPDLPEDGPLEVRRAARAFNDMQQRLRGLINDRTQMLASISHDLRTPITRLRLRAEWVDDREQRDKMLKDLEQMEAMIAATLAFAREDSAAEPRKDLDLALLVQSVCDDAADSGHDVVFRSKTQDTLYNGRPLALSRVFTNLIDNAVKYAGLARVSMEVDSQCYRIIIADSGPGIPDTVLDRVFEPFYRVESSRNRETGGTGLGLAVVRSIIRGHGGEVTLANRAEGGLRVTVSLPLAWPDFMG